MPRELVMDPREVSPWIKIRTPDFPGKWDRDGYPYVSTPALTAVEKSGLFPLPPRIRERLDGLPDLVRLPADCNRYNLENVRKNLRGEIRALEERYTIKDPYHFDVYRFSCRHRRSEFLLQNALRPDDFSFDDRRLLFEYFANEIFARLEKELANKYRGHYDTHPPYNVVSESCTLKEWNATRRSIVESRLSEFIEAETAIRRIDQFDWEPLSFIFGSESKVFAKLQAAVLTSKLNQDVAALKQEMSIFAGAVHDASRIGTMRENSHNIDSVLFGKFRFKIHITDVGTGAAIAGAMKNTADAAAGTVKGVADFAMGVGVLAALPFVLLFGKKK